MNTNAASSFAYRTLTPVLFLRRAQQAQRRAEEEMQKTETDTIFLKKGFDPSISWLLKKHGAKHMGEMCMGRNTVFEEGALGLSKK